MRAMPRGGALVTRLSQMKLKMSREEMRGRVAGRGHRELGRGEEDRQNSPPVDEDRMSVVGEWGHEQPRSFPFLLCHPDPSPTTCAAPTLYRHLTPAYRAKKRSVGKVSYVIGIDCLAGAPAT